MEGRGVLGDSSSSEDAVSCFLPPSGRTVGYNDTSLALKAQGLSERAEA